ncbi:MAG: hypothetical protein KAH57_04515 [Thermoplasmata archaeon]|nr:hypothetical protein [Thermoplasmata archaeon]
MYWDMEVTNNITLLEKIYAFLLRRKVVNKYEFEEYANEVLNKDINYLYRKFIFKLMKQGKVDRIRNGLYIAKNIYLENDEVPNKYLIGSKVRRHYYLGYHTALEIYGCAQSVHHGCYTAIDVKSRFKRFTYGNYIFHPVVVNDVETEIYRRIVDNYPVNVSSPSRTFVECIHRPDLCVGYEEVYKSLESLGGVDVDLVILVLSMYGSDLLIRAVGFFLEDLAARSPYYSHIEEQDLKRIQKLMGHNRTYLIRGQSGEYEERWKLYIPEGFRELFLGVR